MTIETIYVPYNQTTGPGFEHNYTITQKKKIDCAYASSGVGGSDSARACVIIDLVWCGRTNSTYRWTIDIIRKNPIESCACVC